MSGVSDDGAGEPRDTGSDTNGQRLNGTVEVPFPRQRDAEMGDVYVFAPALHQTPNAHRADQGDDPSDSMHFYNISIAVGWGRHRAEGARA